MDNDLIVYTAVPVDDAEKLRLQEFLKINTERAAWPSALSPTLLGACAWFSGIE